VVKTQQGLRGPCELNPNNPRTSFDERSERIFVVQQIYFAKASHPLLGWQSRSAPTAHIWTDSIAGMPYLRNPKARAKAIDFGNVGTELGIHQQNAWIRQRWKGVAALNLKDRHAAIISDLRAWEKASPRPQEPILTKSNDS
jgi:hypothetical protein